MSTLLITGASWLLAVTGGFFLLTGSIGLLRMPDFFTRVHAASLIDSLGALLILAALAIYNGWELASVKIAMIMIGLLITSPTAIHAMCKTARHHADKE